MPRTFLCCPVAGFIILLTLACPFIAGAQQPPSTVSGAPHIAIHHKSTLDHSVIVESDCSNGIDDDNNGLTDAKDFHCYFGSANMEECTPTKIIWASSNWGIHWIDLETNKQQLILPRDAHTYDDLTWAANGKLYGAERLGGIFEIDPYTFENKLIGDLGKYYYANAMTADAFGWLYLAAFTTEGKCDIVRYNLATKKLEVILELSRYNTRAAGDMCFLNGYLYVTCMDMQMVRINIKTKAASITKIKDCPVLDGPYGMTTLGDGFLYISNNMSSIYRLDPETMTAVYFSEIDQPNIMILGFTSYADICNSNVCKASVKISTGKFPPYCAATGVSLIAAGSGIKGSSTYTWTLPGGVTQEGDVINASKNGVYHVNYHTSSYECEAVDSITLNILEMPQVTLPRDTFVCTGSQLTLKPVYNEYAEHFSWDDGTALSSRQVNAPGKYWVEATNHCGIASDTIIVTERARDKVFIGNDTLICKYESVVLKNLNFFEPAYSYKWSNGSRESEIEVKEPGRFTLDVSTSCGTVSDTIIVGEKIEGCECFIYIPNAFTPNNDGKNETFSIQSNCKLKGTMQVFNRWGGLIYSSADISRGWNGYVGSHAQPSGMYVYQVVYEYVNRPGRFVKKGTIMLVH